MSSGILFALLAALFFSVQSVANKYLVRPAALGALPATFITQSLAGVAALVLILAQGLSWVPSATVLMLITTLLATAGFTLAMVAYAREDASVVAAIVGVKIIFIALLEPIFFDAPLSARVWLGAVFSMLGIVFISQRDRWSLQPRDILRPGVLYMAASALAFSVTDLLMSRIIDRWHGNAWAVSLYQFVTIAVLTTLALFLLPAIRRRWPGALVDCTLTRSGLRTGAWPLVLSILGIFFAQYFFFQAISASERVTLANIVMNTRGLLVVLIMLVIVRGGGSTIERAGWRAYLYRIIGAVLTLLALGLAAG